MIKIVNNPRPPWHECHPTVVLGHKHRYNSARLFAVAARLYHVYRTRVDDRLIKAALMPRAATAAAAASTAVVSLVL